MAISRRQFVGRAATAIAGASVPAHAAASLTQPGTPASNQTNVYVLGTIHGLHRDSVLYSLDVFADALRRAAPDRLLAEIPPYSIAEAYRTFAETGRVTESRTRVFPEYLDVAFPLLREMDFEIVGTAGWTRKIASDRSAALRRIANDPARADQWAEHIAARRALAAATQERGDDPAFIHTPEYDALVERGQTPYQQFFDDDLGRGGWTQINAAHNTLINMALDNMPGTGSTAVITYGGWHKYMILRALSLRTDIILRDARELFA